MEKSESTLAFSERERTYTVLMLCAVGRREAVLGQHNIETCNCEKVIKYFDSSSLVGALGVEVEEETEWEQNS